ncbi:OsmC family protein [Thermaerobacter marianensis DSM 12885]|uniref:OsmC family protein n=1 Tax=Thermaerobacter marianensis (strain ATCC 700841 / DSM 12885 / JCM 10246 / 7p75a) TaxID=644966 RepID=E6SHA1_THEM7|nr:OsmC family protein [Thermaerobacter marianensis]ADU51765.1 OsmC family protein [Thermaerobacter marianensis DSM 12885]
MSESPVEAQGHIVTLRATSSLEEGVRSRIQLRDFAVVADEPAELGGTDRGPNPMEYVLGGLVSCLTVMIRLIAAERQLRVDGVDFDVEGDLDLRGLYGTAPVRPDFLEVRGTVWLDTPEDPDRIALLRDEVYRRCPAYNLYRRAGIPVQLEWRIRGRS